MTRQLSFGAWRFCPDSQILEREGESFHLEPRVASLLEYFLANPGEVLSHEQLVGVVWNDRVVSDDAIRRAVCSLRHALAADGTDQLITTVHKKGYLANLPPATVVPARADSPPGAAARLGVDVRSSSSWLFLLLLLLLVAAWLWLPRPAPSSPVADGPPYALAVLPFIDLSEKADQAYLADGLAEELIGLLQRFTAFRVPAPSSSFQFRDRMASPLEVGDALGVDYLVEGSVRRDGDQVRIDVHLVETDSGYQLWSASYNRSIAGLFALQADIATEVARALQVVLVTPDRPAARALEGAGAPGAKAYLEYLEARQLMASWATPDLEKAIVHLQNAISLAPDFAPAYTRLAEAMLMNANNQGVAEFFGVRETALTLIEKSMALDPELGEAYGLRGLVRLAGEEELMEQDLLRSIALSPTFTPAYELLAQRMFFDTGRREEAIALIDRARALDPLWPRGHYSKALMMLGSCEHELAAELAREALRVNPRFRSALVLLGTIAALRGDLAEAVQLQEQAFKLDPRASWVRQRLHMTYLHLGELAAAREVADSSFNSRLWEQYFLGNHVAGGEMIYAADLVPIAGEVIPWELTTWLLAAAMTSGDYARARRYLAEDFGYAGGLPETMDPGDRFFLLNLLLIWYGPGYDGDGRAQIARWWAELTATALDTHGCIRGYQPIAQALADVSLGHMDEAVAVLGDAVNSGGIVAGWHWIIPNHPGFAPLLQEPRFQRLLQQRHALVLEQREELARLRAGGAVPFRGQARENLEPG